MGKYKVTRLPAGRVRNIQVEYDTARVIIEQQKQALEARMLPLLDDLTDDELADLAGNCSEEKYSDHCLYCEAWSLYVDRQEAKKRWQG